MKFNRLIMVLVLLTFGMQAAILYRQFQSASAPTSPAKRPKGPIVRDAPKGTTLGLAGVPIRGNIEASVVLVEFSDYECPFCSRHASEVAPLIDQEFVASGKMRQAFVNNPLPIHAEAQLLAAAAICGGEQGRYWELHDGLFSAKPRSVAAIVQVARLNGVDSKRFETCLSDSPQAKERISRDIAIAKEFQFTGTPSFAIGVIDTRGDLKVQKFISGAQPISIFENAINEVMNSTRVVTASR